MRGGHVDTTGSGELRSGVTRGSVMDITERVLAEQALSQTEERFKQAVRASQWGIFDHDHLTDPEGENLYWSSGLRELMGVSDGRPGGVAAFGDRVHPEDLHRIGEALRVPIVQMGTGTLT